MKYVIITGGVISSIGKGITVSSIGLIFKFTATKIPIIKVVCRLKNIC